MTRIDETILSILQMGITHARDLSYNGKADVAADLLDALDNFAPALFHGSEAKVCELRSQLSEFHRLHPMEVPNYVALLENRYSAFRQTEEQ